MEALEGSMKDFIEVFSVINDSYASQGEKGGNVYDENKAQAFKIITKVFDFLSKFHRNQLVNMLFLKLNR